MEAQKEEIGGAKIKTIIHLKKEKVRENGRNYGKIKAITHINKMKVRDDFFYKFGRMKEKIRGTMGNWEDKSTKQRESEGKWFSFMKLGRKSEKHWIEIERESKSF